jgi:hypothetical protein
MCTGTAWLCTITDFDKIFVQAVLSFSFIPNAYFEYSPQRERKSNEAHVRLFLEGVRGLALTTGVRFRKKKTIW